MEHSMTTKPVDAETDYFAIPLPAVDGLYVLGPATRPKQFVGSRAVVIEAFREGLPKSGKPSVAVRVFAGDRVSTLYLDDWDPNSKFVTTAVGVADAALNSTTTNLSPLPEDSP